MIVSWPRQWNVIRIDTKRRSNQSSSFGFYVNCSYFNSKHRLFLIGHWIESLIELQIIKKTEQQSKNLYIDLKLKCLNHIGCIERMNRHKYMESIDSTFSISNESDDGECGLPAGNSIFRREIRIGFIRIKFDCQLIGRGVERIRNSVSGERCNIIRQSAIAVVCLNLYFSNDSFKTYYSPFFIKMTMAYG